MTERKVIATEAAPGAVGPYSQGILSGDLLYTAGQIPLDPKTGKLIEGDIGVQTAQVLRNLEAILAAAGMGWSNVIKTTVFLADMGDFKAMNEIYATVFTSDPPARSTVQAAGLPLGARIEIELIARQR